MNDEFLIILNKLFLVVFVGLIIKALYILWKFKMESKNILDDLKYVYSLTYQNIKNNNEIINKISKVLKNLDNESAEQKINNMQKEQDDFFDYVEKKYTELRKSKVELNIKINKLWSLISENERDNLSFLNMICLNYNELRKINNEIKKKIKIL